MISDVSNVSEQELDVGDWLEVNADLVDQSVSFTVWPRDNSSPSFAPWLSNVLRYVIDCNSHCLLIFDMFLWSVSTGIHSAGWMYDKWQDSSARITMITLLLSIRLKPRRCKGISAPCWSPKYLADGKPSLRPLCRSRRFWRMPVVAWMASHAIRAVSLQLSSNMSASLWS